MLNIGSNGINHRNVENIDINTIADRIINFTKKCSTAGVKDVMISPIFLKRQFKLKTVIHKANNLLRDKCKGNDLNFVCIVEMVYIPLNNEGTCIFAGNLVDYLNDFILSRNI